MLAKLSLLAKYLFLFKAVFALICGVLLLMLGKWEGFIFFPYSVVMFLVYKYWDKWYDINTYTKI